jgi:hypothetical protein
MTRRSVPILPDPPGNLPPEVAEYLRDVIGRLRTHFRDAAQPATIGAERISVPANRFPTAAQFADLRSGDFYVDASNFVRMKP